MAVKYVSVRATYARLFLSRLCGGEELVDVLGSPHIFLSRLCGGEDGEPY